MKNLIYIFIFFASIGLKAQDYYQGTLTTATAKVNQMAKTIDSLNAVIVNNRRDFVAWQNNANARIRVKSDSIRILKKTIDSLKMSQFLDTIEFIGFVDTIAGTYTKIYEKEYAITPKFSWQIVKRYPFRIGAAIKTKEVTITELIK